MPSASPDHTRPRRLALAAAVFGALLALMLIAGGSNAGAASAKLDKPKKHRRHAAPGHHQKPKKLKHPNIVIIQTDDQSLATMVPEAMPNLFNTLIPRSTSFSDYVVTTPLCCPSRAALMTGEYGHNNGVLRNFYPDLKQKENVLPVWLKRAGYNTAHVGKFLNSYEEGELGPAAVAPGWDHWFTELEPRRYYNWKASKNGRVRHYGYDDDDHVTKVTSDFASRWTKRLVKKKDPFFLQVDFYAPHASTGRDTRCSSGPVPEPVDEHRFDDYPLPQPANFNEEDVSDKPENVQERPPLDEDTVAAIERRYRCTLEALYGVDRGIGRIMREIQRKHELDQTVFVYISDNGFFYGEHRIDKGKPDPYEENIHMPLFLSVPRHYRDRAELVPQSDAPVANIDLSPTLLDLADADPCRSKRICRTLDGRSLMPLIDGNAADFPDPRGIALEINACDYRGTRFDHQVYLEYGVEDSSGGCTKTDTEYYDLLEDPAQLENGYPAPDGSADADAIDRLRGMTADLSDCAGIEGRDPEPKSGHYCQ
jgi:N-acetylglucosamine-6-sulfatase